MKDIFVPKELSEKLREIGFNEKSKFFYMRHSPITSFKLSVVKEHTDGDLLYHGLTEFESVKSGIYPYIEDGIQYGSVEYLVAPTWEQVFKWFREKYYHGIIDKVSGRYAYFIRQEGLISGVNNFETYEQCREALLLNLIEIYKNGQRTNKK